MYPASVHVHILRDAVEKRARGFIIPSKIGMTFAKLQLF